MVVKQQQPPPDVVELVRRPEEAFRVRVAVDVVVLERQERED